jgi:hypothetical protein
MGFEREVFFWMGFSLNMTGFYRQKRELSVGAQHGDEPWLRVMSFSGYNYGN